MVGITWSLQMVRTCVVSGQGSKSTTRVCEARRTRGAVFRNWARGHTSANRTPNPKVDFLCYQKEGFPEKKVTTTQNVLVDRDRVASHASRSTCC